MRIRPLRWLWGLVPILAWTAITVMGEHRSIEADLTERSVAVLKEAGLGWAEPSFAGRDGVVTGKAAEDTDPVRAAQTLQRLWGVRIVENRADLIETADAYVWGANLRDSRVKLSGFIPNEEIRRTIYGVAQAMFPGREIQDQTKLARGAPPRDAWLGGVTFALKQLSHLKRGSVDLDRTALVIEGDAADAKSYAALKAALTGGLPTGVTVKEDRVRPAPASPYTWSLAWDGKQLSVAGHSPGEKPRDELAASVRKAFPKATLSDRTEIASGEPRDFLKVLTGLLPAVAAMDEASVEIRDTQITLTGLSATDVAAESVRERLKAVVTGTTFRLADQIKFREQVPKPVSPFVTAITVDGGRAVVTGYAPGETHRTQLLDALRTRLPDLKIEDKLETAAGAPDGWLACLDAGVALLGKVKPGTLRLTDRTLALTGATDDEELHAALPAQIKASANRACDTESQVALNTPPEPNLAWRAVRSAADLRLDGHVPSTEVKAELAKAAATLFPGVAIVDRTTVQAADARKWPKVADAGLKALARLRIGEASIAEQTLTVSGEAADASRAAAVKDILSRTLPRGYAGRETVALRSDAMIWAEQEAKRKADEEAKRKAGDDAKRSATVAPVAPAKQAEADRCTVLLGTAARAGRIAFEFASAEIQTDSHPTLNQLVEIAKTCPDARIEISGHTDATGAVDLNEALSQKQAEAVVDYLVAAGVTRTRLTATGYGATRPLVPNTSAENRAQNRRIEFEATPR